MHTQEFHREDNILYVFNVDFRIRNARDGRESILGEDKVGLAWILRAGIHNLHVDRLILAWFIVSA